MQDSPHYATELVHATVCHSWQVMGQAEHGSRKALQLILSFLWKCTKVRQTTQNRLANWVTRGRQLFSLPSSLSEIQIFLYINEMQRCSYILLPSTNTIRNAFSSGPIFFLPQLLDNCSWCSTKDFSMQIVHSNIHCAQPLLSCLISGIRTTIRGV